ncbi:MAG: alpha/beta hydrolase [Candidatus Omnitrophica bacterium]|nr:alpha/beta hydrolase [Candidatus Omnitrophota bacterium]
MEKPVVFKGHHYSLTGILHLPFEEKTEKKFPGIILCHGFSGNKSESHFIFTRLARNLAKAKIVCFRFDFMGSGDSCGYFEDMTLETEIHDAASACKYLAEQPFIDKNKIGILGLSMGVIPAVAAAARFQLKAICLWSPVAFPRELKRKILTARLKKALAEKGIVYLPGSGLRIGKGFIDSLNRINPFDMAGNFKNEVLIIHSKDDGVISVIHALSYFKAFHCCAKTKQLIILEKGGHTFVIEEAEDMVLEKTKEFFINTLFT